MFSRTLFFCLVSLALPLTLPAYAQIEEIIVTSDFRQAPLLETPASISIIGEAQLTNFESNHLEEVLSLAPNVHFSSGANRGRYFQIRGLGERSQFVDPINSSIGLIVDGIDFSGIGGAATLFDVQQVEIARGPQGTRYGSNALGGLITIQSNQPTEKFEGQISGGLGSISENEGTLDSWHLGAVISGAITDTLKGRFAIEKNTSDGYVDNTFLNRDDTNNVDELTARARLLFEPNKQLTIGLTALYVDADNGYDVFNLDNSYDTISDQPGSDIQQSSAVAIDVNYRINDAYLVEFSVSHANSDIEYSYDEDWTFDGFDPIGYTAFDQYIRDRQTTIADIRILSTSESNIQWVAGIYARQQEVDFSRDETFLGGIFTSNYKTNNLAIYGQASTKLSTKWHLSGGLRLENFNADYSDNNNITSSPNENLLGGHITLEYDANDNNLLYARIARGYKAGGANASGIDLLASNLADASSLINYETESLINYELGLKGSLDDSQGANFINYQVAAFYYDRSDAQVQQSLVQPPPCPCTSFTEYIDNAASANALGLEIELQWIINQYVKPFAAIGLINAEFDDYASFAHVNADSGNGISVDLSSRDIPQAPNYQLTLGADIQLMNNLDLHITYEINDDYFISSRHDVKIERYELVDMTLAYTINSVQLSLWAKNLFNEDYNSRGFGSFPNDPRDGYSVNGPYFQKGSPREIGVSAVYDF